MKGGDYSPRLENNFAFCLLSQVQGHGKQQERRSQSHTSRETLKPAPRTLHSQMLLWKVKTLLMEVPGKGQVAFKFIFSNGVLCSNTVSKSYDRLSHRELIRNPQRLSHTQQCLRSWMQRPFKHPDLANLFIS